MMPEMDLKTCADLPTATNLPADGQLNSFGFNQSIEFGYKQIYLIDGKTRIANIAINPSSSSGDDTIWTSLLPPELKPVSAPPYSEIEVAGWSPAVTVSWDPKASADNINAYKTSFKNWAGKMEINTWGIWFDNTMLGITNDGKLKMVNCDTP
jgi:hypothetical protein